MTIAAINNPHCQPRAISWHGVTELAGWTLKLYGVCQGEHRLGIERFSGWRELVAEMLPQPACDALRPGFGFIVMHQAKVGDYLVCCWWDNMNELPIRVFVSAPEQARFRAAGDRDSFCVWDLDVIVHERDAFVRAMTATGVNGDTYILDHIGIDRHRD